MRPFDSHVTTRVQKAVRSFVRNRASDFPISISDLSRRIRYAFPDMVGTEREIADLLAREIILAGGNVSFDGEPAETIHPVTGEGKRQDDRELS